MEHISVGYQGYDISGQVIACGLYREVLIKPDNECGNIWINLNIADYIEFDNEGGHGHGARCLRVQFERLVRRVY